jgi:two-component system NtrC family sensor kinase
MRSLLLLTFIFLSYTSSSQDINKLMQEYDTAKTTTSKANILYKYYLSPRDSVPEMIIELVKVLNHFKKKSDITGMAISNMVIADKYVSIGDYTSSLRYSISSLKNFEDVKDSLGVKQSLFLIGNSLVFSRNFEQASSYFKKAATLTKNNRNILYADNLNGIAYCMIMLKKPDSAFAYVKAAVDIGWKENDTVSLAYYIGTFGEAHLANKNYDSAKLLINQSSKYALQNDMRDLLANNSNDLSQLFYETHLFDSSIYYARKGIYYAGSTAYLLDSYEWLYKAFEKQEQKDSVSKYFRLAVTLRDSLYSAEKDRTVQALNFQEQLWEKEREQEILQAEKDFNHRLTLYIAFGVLIIIIIITALLYRNNQHQKRAKVKIEKAYAALKSTQSQLIQSEKMASLGELTAGIAHEIQNPLNFVNNFSEVNAELIAEADEEVDRGNISEVKTILNDIKENEQKILHHGKRADAIVKGMLEHSKASTGKKEPTNINKLADEYLRLAYHGLRAKDKSFNTDFKTDFDESIGKINVIPQDIGRVLLNLFNNAFYAVNEKKKTAGDSYQPYISVQTKKLNDKVEIIVKDNGNGIPQNIIDKIFQPFFTTKPTGQGTGLGLSLSYDIIKAHGGDIKVETEENRRTMFIVSLSAKEHT